jgi:hypothetical protein
MNFDLDLCGFKSCCECGAETCPVPNLASTLPDLRRGFNSSTTVELPRYDLRDPGFEHRRIKWHEVRWHDMKIRVLKGYQRSWYVSLRFAAWPYSVLLIAAVFVLNRLKIERNCQQLCLRSSKQ